MKDHSVNDAFLALQRLLENFAETEVKNIIACAHLLWLTNDSDRQEEALRKIAKIANSSALAYKNTKTNKESLPFDLSSWEPDDEGEIQ